MKERGKSGWDGEVEEKGEVGSREQGRDGGEGEKEGGRTQTIAI